MADDTNPDPFLVAMFDKKSRWFRRYWALYSMPKWKLVAKAPHPTPNVSAWGEFGEWTKDELAQHIARAEYDYAQFQQSEQE